MKTALDTSVILDVVLGSGPFADSSERAIREAAQQGTLLVCECVLAEISPAFTGLDIEEFLRDWNIVFEPGSRRSSLLAGRMLATYLERRAKPRRMVPDFLVGAHAQTHADRLLARDRGYYRDYFKDLVLLEP